jgi:large subunit ribosomal protein L6
MSRIGKMPIPIPAKVKVEVKGDLVLVASEDGKKKLTQEVTMVNVKVVDKQVVVEAADESRDSRSRHGLYRTLIANMIDGVTKGWERRLEIHGAGYKAELQGAKLMLTVGYTYPREFPIPAGIDLELTNPTTILVKGIDKALVGQTAASLRNVRPPDPYRGKGIRYTGEQAVRKTAKGKK